MIKTLGNFQSNCVVLVTGKDRNLQTRVKKDQIPKICRNSKRAAQKDDKILQKVQSNKESLRPTIKTITLIKIVYSTDQG